MAGRRQRRPDSPGEPQRIAKPLALAGRPGRRRTKKSKRLDFLRHTYATRLFELDEPAKTVQELLGHSNINITLGTYTHVLETQKIKTASLIDAIYDTVPLLNIVSIG